MENTLCEKCTGVTVENGVCRNCGFVVAPVEPTVEDSVPEEVVVKETNEEVAE